jgi:hypothetical protein
MGLECRSQKGGWHSGGVKICVVRDWSTSGTWMNLTYRSHHCADFKVTANEIYKRGWSLTRKGKREKEYLPSIVFIGLELVWFHSPGYLRTYINTSLSSILVNYPTLFHIQRVQISAPVVVHNMISCVFEGGGGSDAMISWSACWLLWSNGQSSWLQIRRPGFDSRH